MKLAVLGPVCLAYQLVPQSVVMLSHIKNFKDTSQEFIDLLESSDEGAGQ